MFKNIIYLFLIISILPVTTNAQIAQDTLAESRVFQLGEVILNTTSKKENVTAEEFRKYNKTDVAQALNTLPSVNFSNTGSRNESSIFLRGFDIRSVPIYIDGIPIYVPFDGYVDLSRFTTADLSKIEVSKGNSSILYGPNAIGGSINMISSIPIAKFELKAKVGLLSGDGYNNLVNIGTKQNKFYFQTMFSQFDKAYTPLSHNFEYTELETNLQRDNSYRKDRKFTSRIGFTPNETDVYSLSYIKQNGEKGNPVYLGSDPLARLRYWQWPYWNKESVYFISKTQLNPKTYFKTRAFIDNFKNKLRAFDDANYDTQTKPSSFTSYYKDKTYGGNLELSTEYSNHRLKSALHYKRDHHNAFNEGQNAENMKDDTFSLGIEDTFTKVKDFKFIAGISYNLRNSIYADDTKIVNSDGSFGQFPKNKNAALNTQLLTQYKVNDLIDMSFTMAYKTRFATMKDRYSYKLGRAIPNPDLKSEEALNLEWAGHIATNKNLSIIPEIFYSHLFNTIQYVDNVQPGIDQMQNSGVSRFYGADISLKYKPLASIDFIFNYSFIKQENLSNPDLLFTYVPENHIFTAIEFQFIQNLLINLNATYNSKRYSTSYGIETPEFAVLNTQISYDIKKDISIEAGVNNIFDKNYTIQEGYPEAGRNYFISLYYNFSSK